MRNRLIISTIIGVACTVFALNAETKKETLSAFANVGFGPGLGGYLINASTTLNSAGTLVKRQEQYINYGGGFHFNAGADYKVFDNISARAQFKLALSTVPPKVEQISEVPLLQYNRSTTYKPGVWGLGVSVVPHFRVLDLLDCYTSAGCGIYFGWCDVEYSNTNIKGSIATLPAFGLSGSVGAEYPVMNEMVVYGEIAYDVMNFSVTTIKHPDGTYTNTVTDYYQSNSTSLSDNSPFDIPGSNLALHIGARFIVF